jgi:hypothetical protein
MKISKKDIFQSLKIVILASVFFVGISYLYAEVWTEPPTGTVPPNNNTSTPINTGSLLQTKTGPLTIGGIFSSYGDVRLSAFTGQNIAYLQARNDSSNSNIDLQLRTQHASAGGTRIIEEVMRLTSNGLVGIGTVAPTTKLDVEGGPIKAGGGLIIETCTVGTTDYCPDWSGLIPETGRMWLIN